LRVPNYLGSTTWGVERLVDPPSVPDPSCTNPRAPTAMSNDPKLGDLQHAIMRVLWEHGESSVSDVHHALLDERGLAPTTIATMLVKMEKKGVVKRRTEGRQFRYSPAVSEVEVQRSMVSELTERLFDGNAAALVNHLLEAQQIDSKELQEIRRLIAEHAERNAAKRQRGGSR
jgi:BlaI family penicillinase repressor